MLKADKCTFRGIRACMPKKQKVFFSFLHFGREQQKDYDRKHLSRQVQNSQMDEWGEKKHILIR